MSRRSKYRPSALDGLPARVSGEWAEEKLVLFEKYADAFTTATQQKFRRVMVDLLAGPGRCIEDGGHEFDGSPLRALGLRRPFDEVILIEEHPQLAYALRSRVGHRATVLEGDCSHSSILGAVRTRMDHRTLALAFVDNLGLTVSFETLRALTAGHRVDLFVTFQTSDLKRNRAAAFSGEDAARWTRFFGDTSWEAVLDHSWKLNLGAEETAVALLSHYEDRLRTIGYRHFARSQRAMRNNKNVELYRILLASENELAVKLFEGISKIAPHGQRSFL